MTAPILITACAIAPVAVMAVAVWRAPLGYQDANGWHAGTPSPCERDAQDGRGDLGEAEFRTIHNLGDTHARG